MNGWIKRLLVCSLVLVICISLVPTPARSAPQPQEGQAVYVVQAGDSLGQIALRFNVNLSDLKAANNISDADILHEGDRLVIPGLEWASGTLVTSKVPYGETLESLSRKIGTEPANLARLNHITSPEELYAGLSLITIESTQTITPGLRVSLAPGQSFLELAAIHGMNLYELAASNDISSTLTTLPGQVLRVPGIADGGPGALPGEIQSLSLDTVPPIQGEVMEMHMQAAEGVTATGTIAGRTFSFFSDGSGAYVALQGIHAMQAPGFYPLTIQGALADGTPFGFSQSVYIKTGDWLFDIPLTVDPVTVDPENTKPEDDLWKSLSTPATPQKQWDGMFAFPSTLLPVDYCLETYDCFPSLFGSRRSYNGSGYKFYHTGLDIAGQIGYDILAAAEGTVVFAEELTVRGGATVIDHGWGVYTAYMHQSEILVKAGDHVTPGQLIGKVGATGRVQGPHLHWEVIVGGVPVDPIYWLERAYP